MEVPISKAVNAVQARIPGIAIPRDFSVGFGTSTLITLVFVPTVYTVFEEGWKGLRRGLHHEAPVSESGD